jgi:hypothetical protein
MRAPRHQRREDRVATQAGKGVVYGRRRMALARNHSNAADRAMLERRAAHTSHALCSFFFEVIAESVARRRMVH